MILSAPDPAADPYVVAALLSLQREAYAVEADLIGDDRLPPLQEDEHALAAWRGRWLTAWDGVDLVGAAAWTSGTHRVDLAKVMVAPSAMRRGIGSALLRRVLDVADGRTVEVATGRDNAPATALYAAHGFDHAGDEQVPPGVWISRFRREP
ncbi:GNAT family N-acetyltransferase [Aeromicrobium sp. CFBP 8757]|uniref:GNAT family N-acetyltransferase n=1 Tax=Aeromicrobium sp. CFBP 8757 TaxID=2775288 RepID=UPI001783CDAD|nr:GNAT family N-acetyltransferase [Aeromicrobium sp. CFBP 8757]MBD8607974.1 GNAT family N-acetyltransferase [Aeromicrobium sp. CFBP 8757]